MDNDFLFNEGGRILPDINNGRFVEPLILASSPEFYDQSKTQQYLDLYAREYFRQWELLKANRKKIEKLAAQTFGRDSWEFKILKRNLDSDPRVLFNEQLKALSEALGVELRYSRDALPGGNAAAGPENASFGSWLKRTFGTNRAEGRAVIHLTSSENMATDIAAFRNDDEINHVFFADKPSMTGGLSRIGFNVNIGGKEIDTWAGVENGAMVFFMDLEKAGLEKADYESALNEGAAQITSYLAGTDNLEGSWRGRNRIRKICAEAGMQRAESLGFKPAMIVSHHSEAAAAKDAFSRAGINKAAVMTAGELGSQKAGTGEALVRKALVRHEAVSAVMAENKILKMDIADIKEFIGSLSVFNEVGNGQMLVDWKIFEEALSSKMIDAKKLRALLSNARKYGVAVHAEYHASGEEKTAEKVKELYDLGFQGVSLDLTALDAQGARRVLEALKGYPLTAVDAPAGLEPSSRKVKMNLRDAGKTRLGVKDVIDLEIPAWLSEGELRVYLSKLPLSNTIIFHSADAEGLIGGSRDITDKKFYASILELMLNYGNAAITDPDKARRLGYRWETASLPELKAGEQGRAQLQAMKDGKLEGSGIAEGSALFDQASALEGSLRAAFLSAVAEKMLIAEKISRENAELGREYSKGRFKFPDTRREEMLGRALMALNGMDNGALAAENLAGEALVAEYQGGMNGLLVRLGAEPAQNGAAAAISELVIRDILTEFNMKKSVGKKYGTLDTGMVKSLLGAG
jgi:hypothetical protein